MKTLYYFTKQNKCLKSELNILILKYVSYKYIGWKIIV